MKMPIILITNHVHSIPDFDLSCVQWCLVANLEAAELLLINLKAIVLVLLIRDLDLPATVCNPFSSGSCSSVECTSHGSNFWPSA